MKHIWPSKRGPNNGKHQTKKGLDNTRTRYQNRTVFYVTVIYNMYADMWFYCNLYLVLCRCSVMYQHVKICTVMSSWVEQYSESGTPLDGMQTSVYRITLILEQLFWVALFIHIHCPYRVLELWQTMIHGLEASSYSTGSCPYRFSGASPLLWSFWPSSCPKPPVCAGLSSTVLSLCFGAGWVWPRLTLT